MGSMSRIAALLVVGAALWAGSAAAQAAPGPAAPAGLVRVPALTPPVARSSTDVPYPKGARGDAVVLLEITVAQVFLYTSEQLIATLLTSAPDTVPLPRVSEQVCPDGCVSTVTA